MPPPEVRLSVAPAQTGELDPTVGVGLALTSAVAVLVPEHPADEVTVTLYTPLLAVGALVMVGDCTDDVKPLGPLHW